MTVEAQTAGAYIVDFAGSVAWDRIVQRLTITNRKVSDLYFRTYRIGSPTGTITFAIRKVSDDSVIASTVWGNAGDVSTNTAGVWIGAKFTPAVDINQEVRIMMEWSGVVGTAGVNSLSFFATGTSVVASQEVARKSGTAAYEATTEWDATYYYIYEAAATATVVSTQKVTAISGSIATGNGRLEVFGSTAGVTQYGLCWDTATNPSTALATKTTLGASTTRGAFTSGITALTPGTLYYVRAYGTDASSTYYGSNVTFTGGDSSPTSVVIAGEIAVVQTNFHYVGDDGVERFITGSIVA